MQKFTLFVVLLFLNHVLSSFLNSTTPVTNYQFTTNEGINQLIFYLQGDSNTQRSIYIQITTPLNSTINLPSPAMADYYTVQQFLCPTQVKSNSLYSVNVFKSFSSSETEFSLQIQQSTESYELSLATEAISDSICCGASMRYYHTKQNGTFQVQINVGTGLGYTAALYTQKSDCPTQSLYEDMTLVSEQGTATITINNPDGSDYWIAIESSEHQLDSWSYQIELCPENGCSQGENTGTGDSNEDPTRNGSGANSLFNPYFWTMVLSEVFVHVVSMLV